MNAQSTGNDELIMVAMSGGVDSSVSALLLQDQGARLEGMFMKNWEEDGRLAECPAEIDARDAEAVAKLVGIPLHTRNFADEYWDHVFEEFLAEYRAGRTPNPDILCNREIKFRTFLEHAEALGASAIATGHYCRTEVRDGRARLLRGVDVNKDQSYFLYAVGHEQLARTRFPVGELEKPAVRARAEAAGLSVHDKKDSTGICFIGERHFSQFLSRYVETAQGEIRTPDDQVIGEHHGLAFHTLGQRQGLGIGGVRGYPDAPWYVLHKDLEHNVLYAGQGHDHPWLLSTRVAANQLSWVTGTAPTPGARLSAKLRYRQADQACQLSSVDGDRLVVTFDEPQRAATPGQSLVLYDGDECLGGGIIDTMNAPPITEALRP
ncbi:MAG: tRNA 2-thiouridine(34) synthase MnmA [Pseudomonadota bacterium]